MNRRALLGAIGLTTTVLTGCIGTNSLNTNSQKDEQEYERCGKYTVWVSSLPEPAQEEVTAALENGEYETRDDLILSQVINVDESYLKSLNPDGELPHYYAVEIEEEGDRTRLRLKKTRPPLNQTIPLRGSIEHTVMVDVVITYDPENETLIDETFELSPDEEIELGGGRGWRYGSYHVAITVRTDNAEASTERTLTLDHQNIDYWIDVHSGSENTSLGVHLDEGYGASSSCSWDSDGNFEYDRG